MKTTLWTLWACIISLLLPLLTSSFQINGCWVSRGQRQAQLRSRRIFTHVEDASPTEEDQKQNDHSQSIRQHWLDLRGTAIRPEEALVFFDEFLWENDKKKDDKEEEESSRIKNLIDCIIVPEDTLKEIPEGVTIPGIELLVVENGSDCLQHTTSGERKGGFVRPLSWRLIFHI